MIEDPVIAEMVEYAGIVRWLNDHGVVQGYTIRSDWKVDIDRDLVITSEKRMRRLPIALGTVGGDFAIAGCVLETLQGAPRTVRGNCKIYSSQLKSLEGAPQHVGRDFSCANNGLTSLVGGPVEVLGKYDCTMNQLTSLRGAPPEVDAFDCSHNHLTSLVGGPISATNFTCRNNLLRAYLGGPLRVTQTLDCSENPIEDLTGIPISRHLILSYDPSTIRAWLKYTEEQHAADLPIAGTCFESIYSAGNSAHLQNKWLFAVQLAAKNLA